MKRVSGRAPERFPACRDHPRSLMISVKEDPKHFNNYVTFISVLLHILSPLRVFRVWNIFKYYDRSVSISLSLSLRADFNRDDLV